MTNLLAILDVDETVAETIVPWLRRYNRKYHDNLKVEDIVSWDLAKYTVPECGEKVYDILEKGNLYRYVKPIPNSLKGVNKLRKVGFEIVYATAGTPKASVYKYDWLKEHNFWQHGDHYVQTFSKQLIKGDLMIDDNYANLAKFNGFGVLLDWPWNREYEFINRVADWEEINKTLDFFV